MSSSFDGRKARGDFAEVLLCELLTDRGAIVTCHQRNFDATRDRGGAAVAYGPRGEPHHLPDQEVRWPDRRPLDHYFLEVKAKRPFDLGGGWGWDVYAFNRALRWMELTGVPAFYAIRNTADVPLPPMRRAGDYRDDPDLWVVASLWKLAHSDNRSVMNFSCGRFYGWPASEFMPLRVLLDGAFAVQCVPYLPHDLLGDVRVPRLL